MKPYTHGDCNAKLYAQSSIAQMLILLTQDFDLSEKEGPTQQWATNSRCIVLVAKNNLFKPSFDISFYNFDIRES